MAGPEYADRTRAAYVLHMLDEFIHHGAEIALLRDLWRWQHTPSPTIPASNGSSAATRRARRVRRASRRPPSSSTRPPRYGRWDLVIGLVQRGAPVSTTGRTPLHLAAGAGELDVVKVLLDHGADPTAKDPEFHATPLQWAEFLRHPARRRVSESNTRVPLTTDIAARS